MSHPAFINTPSSHSGCCVCGQNVENGLALRFSASSDGTVSAPFMPSTKVQGYAGQVHGGVIATLLDGAMAQLLFFEGVEAVTAELQVRYVKPVPVEGNLSVRAKREGQRRNLHLLVAEVRSETGDVLAWAKGKFLPRGPM
ncbi:PaaI family thioesterase [Pseudovibrio exalbescens]|uniref:PaaI family thioesterase n=1 Tax=Pseudovibrio exalbescens TaxID=197461 RepID=UPI0023668923|nr:PaaI family thioesterase [Pseudovibrio exalbescens]MDD7910788.1 PaaI family thioesterase [Pseudovibrio exalbescens]